MKWAQAMGMFQEEPSPPTVMCAMKSALLEKDVVVSDWFVGAQQGEAVSEAALSVSVSLRLL